MAVPEHPFSQGQLAGDGRAHPETRRESGRESGTRRGFWTRPGKTDPAVQRLTRIIGELVRWRGAGPFLARPRRTLPAFSPPTLQPWIQ